MVTSYKVKRKNYEVNITQYNYRMIQGLIEDNVNITK